MTLKQNWQFTVTYKEEILRKCEESDYTDCRINAYPEYVKYQGIVRQPPDFAFIDLDLTNFDNDRDKIDRTLKRIANKICRLGTEPTILWSGNGYHIYLPLDAMVLDKEEVFAKDKFPSLFKSTFSTYHEYSVSELFLKFAENYFTNGKADPLHHPKYGNSLVRILGTYNSKCLNRGLSKEESEVKIIQKWNGKRLPIQLLLKDFRRWITQEDINGNKKQSNSKLTSKLSSNFNQKGDRIDWIENLLKTPIEDQRNYCLWRIIGPYLLNVRNLSKSETTIVMEDWLSKCDKLRKLDFEPKTKIYSIIKSNRGYKPISFLKLHEEGKEIYAILKPTINIYR